ncbi:sirohydrochlorin chelatase [Paucibacter sp. Y2R2-4]|uniref:sirohydrochlorin chelatase n=1 Tax=Paucibacter sp. Y2R2-4 TaxID=2893553 RepID=UPI0021E3C4B9|nr:CbiX/SirB N-terminal domain-containing protein [Paucibacter sp. Y2R2-4]MCV2348598.1 CbiX/SirB N-terminal domain-containing protein [Paucibacter sp. Y2R2-4]
MNAMLLFAHGARDPDWARPFKEVERRIRLERPEMPLTLAFLEFMQPSLEEAAHELVAQGCRRIHIVPMFLGTGGHVRRDIPPLIERLTAQYGTTVEWLLRPAIGDQERVVQAMTEASLSWLPSDMPARDTPRAPSP